MPKLSYLLISTAKGQYPSPLGVCGRSTVPYGFATYDREHNAHCYRVSQEQWEGGMDRDVTENKNRTFGKWIVRAEQEPDLETPEGQQAAEIDRLKARIAELEQQVPSPAAPDGSLSATLPPEFQEAGKALASMPDTRLPSPQEAQQPNPGGNALSRYRQLRAEAKAANEQGAQIDLSGNPSTEQLQAALRDWKNKAA